MHFCVCCGNLLQLEAVGNNMRFYCQTCPYVYKLRTRVISEVPLEHKAVDDVLGGPEAWKNADQTDAVRPCSSAWNEMWNFLAARSHRDHVLCVCMCSHRRSAAQSAQIDEPTISSARSLAITWLRAHLCLRSRPLSLAHRLQIRSADEPMTTFYKCTECGMRWRED